MANAVRRITLSAPRRAWIATARRGNWLPVWSPAAALRAIRAALVLTSLFALTDKVIGNLQMATFAAFGSFATLVLASFSGSWREKLRAHLALALAGSVLLTIGTAVASSTAVAVLVTVPVAFAVFFAGVTGPNAAGGVTGALLAYVLPAASPGAISMVPDRLAGWWLASVAGTAAVLALSPRPGANPLRAASAKLASSLADQIETALDGRATAQQLEALIFDKHELMERFSAAPYRPTGLTAVEEALANCVELLEWTTYLVADGLRERSDLRDISAPDRELLGTASDVLRDSASLLAGRRARPDLAKLAELRARAREIRGTQTASAIAGESGWREAAQASFHAHAIASAVLAAARDVAKACGLDEHADVLARRSRAARSADRVARVSAAVARDASVRSVWFINSVRGAVALAGAVAVADVSSVQHGFWVVLGTLSVLRTNASSTGSTALRALVGTAIGFVIGGALLLAIGAASAALWIVLPIAVLVAAYTPGTAPFAFGQAAFTVTIAVLFNLLVPVGWKVGVVRIEDVALGCGVSLLVGTLFWPRGLGNLVGDDLADAFRSGASYLAQAVEWVCGADPVAPATAEAASAASLRLDEALRAFVAERGTKHIDKQQMWRLVGGSLRLRLTAEAVTRLPPESSDEAAVHVALRHRASTLTAWFERLAELVGKPHQRPIASLGAPTFSAADRVDPALGSRYGVWLCEHLDHLSEHLGELVAPAVRVAEIRRLPWWR